MATSSLSSDFVRRAVTSPDPVATCSFRQIHLDFHTSPLIPDVGERFDAEGFAEQMQAARVSSVTVFAKCHHGHLYYDTERPERHPHLRRSLDLMGAQVDALHRRGIRAPIYMSVMCDEFAANEHPEWIARNLDTSIVKGSGLFTPGWQILDMSSPYQDFLAEQLDEVLEFYDPVDGVFFDMCWDQPSVSKYALAAMAHDGLDPMQAADRLEHARRTSRRYMERYFDAVKAANPDATVYFNGRSYTSLRGDIDYMTHIEVESLPTGGWGYVHFPKSMRSLREFKKPILGMTSRFHKSWADFGGLKPHAAMHYETCRMMASGARISVGDQLHPDGSLDVGAYQSIGEIFSYVESLEPWLEGARPVDEVGVVRAPDTIADAADLRATSAADEGLTRLFQQLRLQFSFVELASVPGNIRLLVVPDSAALDATDVIRLRRHVGDGGSLLVTGSSVLAAEGAPGAPAARELRELLGIDSADVSPYQETYFRFREPGASSPIGDHVMYEQGVRVRGVRDAKVIATLVEPYFQRAWDHFSSHAQTPPARATDFATALSHGNAGYVAYPVFSAFARHGNFPYRLLVDRVLKEIMPDRLLTVTGPTGLEANVMVRGSTYMVHLTFAIPERRAANIDIIEDIVPLRDLQVSLRMNASPARVYVAPGRERLDFTFSDNRVVVRVPEVRGHTLVVFES